MWVHPAIVEVALFAGTRVTVRERLFFRALTRGDPFTLVTQTLVLGRACFLGLEVVVHHRRLCAGSIRILVLVDTEVERHTRLFAFWLGGGETVTNRDVIRLVVFFVEATPFDFGAVIEAHMSHARW